jgi:hypothetical protein
MRDFPHPLDSSRPLPEVEAEQSRTQTEFISALMMRMRSRHLLIGRRELGTFTQGGFQVRTTHLDLPWAILLSPFRAPDFEGMRAFGGAQSADRRGRQILSKTASIGGALLCSVCQFRRCARLLPNLF